MTSNPASIVDPDKFTVRRTIRIAAPLQAVWDAVTQPDKMAKWFPQTVTLEPLAVGAEGRFTFEGYGSFPVVVEALDAPHLISYRWSNDSEHPVTPVDPAHSTVFTFTLEPADDGTILTVVETGFGALADPARSLDDNRQGWDAELDELVAYLEGA